MTLSQPALGDPYIGFLYDAEGQRWIPKTIICEYNTDSLLCWGQAHREKQLKKLLLDLTHPDGYRVFERLVRWASSGAQASRPFLAYLTHEVRGPARPQRAGASASDLHKISKRLHVAACSLQGPRSRVLRIADTG